MGVARKRFQIHRVRREHGASGFSDCDADRIDRGASSSLPAQLSGSTRERLPELFDDLAGFQKLVLGRVASGVPL
jgi:hypothetical protein